MTDTPFCRILCNTSIKFEQYRFRKYLSEYGGIPIKRQESNVITWKIWRTLLLIYLNRKHKMKSKESPPGGILYLHIHTACILCLHFQQGHSFIFPKKKSVFVVSGRNEKMKQFPFKPAWKGDDKKNERAKNG